MFDSWRLEGRHRLAVPATDKTCRYGWLIRSWVIVAFCLLGISPAVGQDYQYSLGTGDLLRVTVFGHEDLSGQFEVDSAGRISLPLVGKLLVVNRSVGNVEQLVVSALKPDYLKNPQISVEIINYRPFDIIGEVANPGSYPFVARTPIITAVAKAGGFTNRAKEDDLLLTRAKGKGKQEHVGQETPVFPGDVIEGPERFF